MPGALARRFESQSGHQTFHVNNAAFDFFCHDLDDPLHVAGDLGLLRFLVGGLARWSQVLLLRFWAALSHREDFGGLARVGFCGERASSLGNVILWNLAAHREPFSWNPQSSCTLNVQLGERYEKHKKHIKSVIKSANVTIHPGVRDV